jgi:hypothetical protein
MKYYIGALALSIMAMSPAFARDDSTPANAGSIGAEQAVFDFCSQVDRAQGPNFDKQAKQLVAGLSRDAIDSLLESTAYRQGYQTLKSVLREFAAADALTACQAIVK